MSDMNENEVAGPAEPTLSSVRAEIEEAAQRAAQREAERAESMRLARKKHLLHSVLRMQEDLEAFYATVKQIKADVKDLRKELRDVENMEELTIEDLEDLLRQGAFVIFGDKTPASNTEELFKKIFGVAGAGGAGDAQFKVLKARSTAEFMEKLLGNLRPAA